MYKLLHVNNKTEAITQYMMGYIKWMDWVIPCVKTTSSKNQGLIVSS